MCLSYGTESNVNLLSSCGDSKATGPQSVRLPTPGLRSADYRNTITAITTCSPSLQAGSGSVCELQPSERAPPLYKEDKEKKENKQKGGEKGEEKNKRD